MASRNTRVTFARTLDYDGKQRKAGSSLNVPNSVARSLIARGTARLADEKDTNPAVTPSAPTGTNK